MSRLKSRALLALSLASTLSLLCLSACNDAAQAQNVGNDWIDNTSPNPPQGSAPAPTPAPSPSPIPTADQVYSGPAELNPYVVKFLTDAQLQGRDVMAQTQNPKLEIQLASLSSYGSSTIGLCETGTNLRRVTFDPNFWASASETQRELLVHHELGHCVLYRAHRTDLLPSGAPASIMYPVLLSSSVYGGNHAYYQQELFSTGTSSLGGVDPNVDTVHICNKGDL